MGRRFTVLEGFFSEGMQSEYVAGFSYEVNDGNDKLNGLVDKWIEDGRVREGGPAAKVTGGDAANTGG